MRDRLFLAVFIVAAAIAATIIVSTMIGTARHSVTTDRLRSIYNEAFPENDCPGGRMKPQFISRADRKSFVAECVTKLSEDEAASLHKDTIQAAGFAIYEDRRGIDGIWSIRACKSGVSVILYIGRAGGNVTLEQRALWSYADFKRLPEKCKKLTKRD